jgi:predicted enzyme related to lactoylglutathione lyase
MNVTNALAGIAVRDIEVAILWYEKLLGRPPDIRPMEKVAAWQFREGGWIEVFTDEKRAGMSTVIFAVASLEEQLSALSGMEIPIMNVTPSANIGEIAIIADPDGNQLVFAGPLSGVMDD